MKTAREFFETHRDLHEQFKTEKIGVRRFEKAIAAMWDEICRWGLRSAHSW
jgi:hypothetical protein